MVVAIPPVGNVTDPPSQPVLDLRRFKTPSVLNSVTLLDRVAPPRQQRNGSTPTSLRKNPRLEGVGWGGRCGCSPSAQSGPRSITRHDVCGCVLGDWGAESCCGVRESPRVIPNECGRHDGRCRRPRQRCSRWPAKCREAGIWVGRWSHRMDPRCRPTASEFSDQLCHAHRAPSKADHGLQHVGRAIDRIES